MGKTNKSPLQVLEERLVKQIIKHDKGKYYVTKPMMINPDDHEIRYPQATLESSEEAIGATDISSRVIPNTVRLENIITLGILAGSSSSKEKFIMFEEHLYL